MTLQKACGLFLAAVIWSQPQVTLGQNEKQLKGYAFILPWLMPGVDLKQRKQMTKNLDSLTRAMAETMWNESQTLSDMSQELGIKLSLSQKRKSETIRAGKMKNQFSALKSPIFLQPLLCDGGPHVTSALIAGRLKDGKILFVSSQRDQIPKTANRALAVAKALDQNRWIAWLEKTLEGAVQSDSQNPPDHFLKLSLSVREISSGGHEKSSECATLLAASSLIQQTPVVLPYSQTGLIHTRSTLKITHPLERPNRRLDLILSPDNLQEDRARAANNFRINYSNAIFGSLIVTQTGQAAFINPSNLRFQPDENISNLIMQSILGLKIEDMPLVTKKDRAWAYLDRGRAWGLELGDRIIYQQGDQIIKGHIVKFFGPEENLKSPRGFNIEDGAIAYIRKGQDDVEIGQVFQFDPTVFPTPWPP